MNILPKKNWHVRNKDNIEKVRRDEAKVAYEEREREKRREIAECEARLTILRNKAGVATHSTTQELHINLFEKEEFGGEHKKNKEREEEKSKEKEKYERKIGLLKYLNEDSFDLKPKPWYETIKRKSSLTIEDNCEIDLKRKALLDPLNGIKEYCTTKDKKKSFVKQSNNASNTHQVKTIEHLRAERLKREQEERTRVDKLLNKNSQALKNDDKIEIDDRKRKYNSQFNPNLSKY